MKSIAGATIAGAEKHPGESIPSLAPGGSISEVSTSIPSEILLESRSIRASSRDLSSDASQANSARQPYWLINIFQLVFFWVALFCCMTSAPPPLSFPPSSQSDHNARCHEFQFFRRYHEKVVRHSGDFIGALFFLISIRFGLGFFVCLDKNNERKTIFILVIDQWFSELQFLSMSLGLAHFFFRCFRASIVYCSSSVTCSFFRRHQLSAALSIRCDFFVVAHLFNSQKYLKSFRVLLAGWSLHNDILYSNFSTARPHLLSRSILLSSSQRKNHVFRWLCYVCCTNDISLFCLVHFVVGHCRLSWTLMCRFSIS